LNVPSDPLSHGIPMNSMPFGNFLQYLYTMYVLLWTLVINWCSLFL